MTPMHKTAILFALLAAAALMPLAAAGQERAPRGVALVVGEGGYANLPALANPPNDARDVGDLLSDLGFDVTTVSDADHRRLTRSFERFAEDAAEADVALVYYSGHGIEAAGANYLVPVDADISTPETAGQSLVPLSGLLDELAKSVPVTIVLLDACRTDPFPAGQVIALPDTGEMVPVDGTGLAVVRGPTPVQRADAGSESLGMVIGFAAEPGAAALDGAPGENSPYAAALIKHVAANGTPFSDIMTMVTEEVYLKTRAQQLPWTNSSLRRVLSFGEAPEPAEGDEALIRDGRRALLMTISTAPEATRRYVETVAANERVPLDALYGMLKVLGVDTADPSAIEAQLEAGAKRLKLLLEQQTGAAKFDPELIRLSDLAGKAEQEGAMDVALKFREQATARADTLEVQVDANEANLKQDRLQIGATYAEHARTAALNYDPATATEMWRKAIAQVEDWDETLAAGYRNNLGVALMEAGGRAMGTAELEEAVQVLEASLQTFDRQSAALDWAHALSNLGNVYQQLGDKERDPERYRQAAEAHERALEVLNRDEHPLDWATAENNLGIAHARLGEGSGDVEELQAAVDAFHLALEERTKERVPLDWAATNDNLGSALSTLGGVLGDGDAFAQGIAAFRATLEVRSRDIAPYDWAFTQRNLGLALKTLGVGTDDVSLLREGAEAYREALTVFSATKGPADWAQTNAILGFALMEIFKRAPARDVLVEARAAFAEALAIYGAQSADDEAYFEGRIAEIDELLG